MRLRSLVIAAGCFAILALSAGLVSAQGQGRGKAADDGTNPRTARFGVWLNTTSPTTNVMTYEAFEKDGSKLTVSNPTTGSSWGYDTLFDGVFRPVRGQDGNETAVEIINAKSIRIINKTKGVVTQVVINTLSADNNTISNEYVRMDKDGKITGVTHATYERKK